MIDLFLRAGSKSAMNTALHNAGLMTPGEDGLVLDLPTDTSVSIIGEIQEQTGTETDPETGNEVPEYAAIDGYHVNVRARDQNVADALSDLAVAPVTPEYVWA